MEIYLIRHTSVDVPAGYAYGQTDVPLKPTFEEEAEEVKKGLSDHTFDKVWTSPLTRCVRLANYCGFPEAEREDRIKEVNFGECEMKCGPGWDSALPLTPEINMYRKPPETELSGRSPFKMPDSIL